MAAEDVKALHERITSLEKRVWEALNELIHQVAKLSAAVQHPDPSHCVQNDRLTKIERRQEQDSARIDKLESTADQATGGGRVLMWLIGSNVFTGLGFLILLIKFFLEVLK